MLLVYAAGIFSQSKSFRDNPVIGSARLNQWGLHIWRRRIARRMGVLRRAQLAPLISDADRAAFERDGFLLKRDFLDPETFRKTRDEILALQTDAREAVIGDTLTRLIPLDVKNMQRVPTARNVLESPSFMNLLAYVGSFKRRPRFYVQTVFTQVLKDAPADIQSFFHSDTFHPTVKAWLYLDDVGAGSCPLTYVPGSHVANARRLAWERRVSCAAACSCDPLTAEGSLRITEEELARLGYRPAETLSVAANTLLVADTSGFHKRTTSEGQARRISIWAYSRSNPFMPWAGGDPVRALPTLQSWGLRMFWFMHDRSKRMSRATGGWRWVGVRTATTPPVPNVGADASEKS
jgi:hypothetical protein